MLIDWDDSCTLYHIEYVINESLIEFYQINQFYTEKVLRTKFEFKCEIWLQFVKIYNFTLITDS